MRVQKLLLERATSLSNDLARLAKYGYEPSIRCKIGEKGASWVASADLGTMPWREAKTPQRALKLAIRDMVKEEVAE